MKLQLVIRGYCKNDPIYNVSKISVTEAIAMPKVSVVIPSYNRASRLMEAMDSVLSQRYRDLELIVVDDGSTDETRGIVSTYGNDVVYLYQERRGVSAARNRGIGCAQGDYLAFLDSDDLWLPRKLSTQMRFIHEHPEVQICYAEEIWIRGGVRVNPMKKHRKYSGMIFEGCFSDREKRGHGDQLSKTVRGQDRYRIKALMKLLKGEYLTPCQRELAWRELNRKCRIYGMGCIKRGRREEGAQIMALPALYAPNR